MRAQQEPDSPCPRTGGAHDPFLNVVVSQWSERPGRRKIRVRAWHRCSRCRVAIAMGPAMQGITRTLMESIYSKWCQAGGWLET